MNRINNFIKEHKTSFIIYSILILLDIIATVILGYIAGAIYNGYKWNDFSKANGTVIFFNIFSS